jgi:hypothetical protein
VRDALMGDAVGQVEEALSGASTGPASAGRPRSIQRGVIRSPALVIARPLTAPLSSMLACITAAPAGR